MGIGIADTGLTAPPVLPLRLDARGPLTHPRRPHHLEAVAASAVDGVVAGREELYLNCRDELVGSGGKSRGSAGGGGERHGTMVRDKGSSRNGWWILSASGNLIPL